MQEEPLLGLLEKVELRDTWPREDVNFMPIRLAQVCLIPKKSYVPIGSHNSVWIQSDMRRIKRPSPSLFQTDRHG
ncbi:hypothetical protein JCM12296A_57710 [Desulfosarcina cetonica]